MHRSGEGMGRKKLVARGQDRPAQWQLVVRMDRWGRTRRGRRIVLAFFILMICFLLWVTLGTLRHAHWPEEALNVTLLPLALVALGIWRMWAVMDRPGFDDKAVARFGMEMDRLTAEEREAIFRDELVRSKEGMDERAKERRVQAESAAFRLLRWILPLGVALYWAVCFAVIGAMGDGHTELVMGAVAASWAAFGVLALPVAIRMWTEPDEVGSPKVVTMEREA
jgi:hypothetical protein